MVSSQFYFVGDEPSTAKSITTSGDLKIEELKRAVGLALHVAQPLGITFHLDEKELTDVGDISKARSPIGLRIDGQAVRSPQGPDGLPFVGSFYEIFPDHLGNHWRLFRKYGSVIKTTNMGKTTYLTDSPEVTGVALMESIYFTKDINPDHPLYGIKDNTAIFVCDTENENWRLAHKFLPPAMGPKAVRHYAALMQECVENSFPVFDALSQDGESWNVYQYMLKLASQTIGKFALGVDFGQFSSVDASLHPIVTNIANLLALNKKITARGSWYGSLPFGDPARLKQVRRTTYELIQDAVDHVKESTPTRDSPLNEAALQASCVVDYLLNGVDERGEHFPESLVLSNMIIVTGAGFTTTSALLSWLIYCLVNYPETQSRLLQELIDHDVNEGTQWDPDSVHSLPYLDKFVKETQRLHNASFQPARTTKTDVVLPGGYRLPPNSIVIPAIYGIHTNPSTWRDPFRFDPDRWDSEEVKKRHKCAYIPFATGPRGCIGFNFALLEVKILISKLVYRYEFFKDGLEAVDYDPEFQLIRPLNLYVSARKRTTWPRKL